MQTLIIKHDNGEGGCLLFSCCFRALLFRALLFPCIAVFVLFLCIAVFMHLSLGIIITLRAQQPLSLEVMHNAMYDVCRAKVSCLLAGSEIWKLVRGAWLSARLFQSTGPTQFQTSRLPEFEQKRGADLH